MNKNYSQKIVFNFTVLILLVSFVSPSEVFSGQTPPFDKPFQAPGQRPAVEQVKRREKPDIVQTMPEPQFIFPKEKAKIKGEVKLKVKIEEAVKVEFYLRKIQSLIPIYLGQAGRVDDDLWQLSWSSASAPNGEYIIFLEIENQYGKYQGEGIEVAIENKIKPDPQKQKEFEEEVKKTEQEIETQEKEIEQKIEEVKEVVRQETQALIEEVTKTVPEEKKEEIKPAIEKNLEQSSQEIEKKVEELAEKSKKEIELRKKIEKGEREAVSRKQKVKQVEIELAEVSEKTVRPQFQKVWQTLKQDKEKKLKEHQEKQKEVTKKKEIFEKELKETKKEKESIKQHVKEKLAKAMKPVIQLAQGKPKLQKAIQRKLSSGQQRISQNLEKLEKIISEKEKIRQEKIQAVMRDSDNDGLSDREELILGTDPLNPDSDGDSYLDGVERETGFDPLDPSPADKIVYEEPPKSKAPISDIYKVERVEIVTLPTEEKALKIEGKGLPHSFVVIYVYSLPLVLVTKTDEAGRFVYILDKPLAEGPHQIYVAITNNKGEIMERSEVFNFLKTPTAVAALLPPTVPEEVISPAGALKKTYTLLVVTLIILGLAVALVIIDILTRQKESKAFSQNFQADRR